MKRVRVKANRLLKSTFEPLFQALRSLGNVKKVKAARCVRRNGVFFKHLRTIELRVT